ncbi:NuA4 histone H4 acetyltransferase complex and the SWR1 complex subunit [Collariella sp. IMI 366227]|nr:NuA4 histone H4 acetyltransferase complex and the SWR1 complex subunit [Collariella sp. IMI 366227]
MAPPTGKRVKGVQVFRPFVYGTTARPFDDKTNPKPPGVPEDHTHSWTVFVKGIDDVDITYWLRRVQFKLHESIPNHVRILRKAANPLPPFTTPPYGRTDDERETMHLNGGQVISWSYEEQIFNEPYEPSTRGGGEAEGGVLERSAMIPLANRPDQPFSRETEQVEIKKLKEALVKVEELTKKTREEMEKREKRLKELKAEPVKG